MFAVTGFLETVYDGWAPLLYAGQRQAVKQTEGTNIKVFNTKY